MRLIDAQSGGRDNHFNAIRLAAAVAVLFAHCYPLALGAGQLDPLSRALGVSLGGLAVDVFFLTSGFLITHSLLARGLLPRRQLRNFVVARALRILPALAVMNALTVLLGLGLSTLAWRLYLNHPGTWAFWWDNTLLLGQPNYALPGVFTRNPYPVAVNGSLWSIPYEIQCYGLLALAWALAGMLAWAAGSRPTRTATASTPRASPRDSQLPLFGAVLLALTLLALCAQLWPPAWMPANLAQTPQLALVFFVGSWARLGHAHIRLSRLGAALSCVVLAASLWTALPIWAAEAARTLAVGYFVLCAAYWRQIQPRVSGKRGQDSGLSRARNGAAVDISYGVYLYAFPVQQTLAYLWPGITPLQLLASALPITAALAWASWHLVERRCLAPKSRLH